MQIGISLFSQYIEAAAAMDVVDRVINQSHQKAVPLCTSMGDRWVAVVDVCKGSICITQVAHRSDPTLDSLPVTARRLVELESRARHKGNPVGMKMTCIHLYMRGDSA